MPTKRSGNARSILGSSASVASPAGSVGQPIRNSSARRNASSGRASSSASMARDPVARSKSMCSIVPRCQTSRAQRLPTTVVSSAS
jgi:hypothetical protein